VVALSACACVGLEDGQVVCLEGGLLFQRGGKALLETGLMAVVCVGNDTILLAYNV